MKTTIIVTLAACAVALFVGIFLAVFDAIRYMQGKGPKYAITTHWRVLHKRAPWITVALTAAALILGIILGHVFWCP